MTYANYSGYTRLMFKTNCPVEFLCALLPSRKHRESQGGIKALLPKGIPWFLLK